MPVPVPSTCTGPLQWRPRQVSALPLPSTATQNEADGQDTDSRPAPRGSISFGADHLAPFQMTDRPRVSTAAQNDGLAQETLVSSTRSPPGSTVTGLDQVEPFQWRALLPDSSTAMQNVPVGQETERKLPL